MSNIASGRNVMVMLAFVGGNHRFGVVRGPLNVLPNWAAQICALVIAPGFQNSSTVLEFDHDESEGLLRHIETPN